MFSKFLPSSTIFFDLFDRHIALTYQAAQKFHESISHGINHSGLMAIKTFEHEADAIIKQCIETLHKTFITPIDRESIYQLVSHIDDVIDCIDAAAECIVVYKIHAPSSELIQLSQILYYSVEQLETAVKGLRTIRQTASIQNACNAINKFEHEADDTLRYALGQLFQEEDNIKQLIKWKEIYETLEIATDRCSDVADIIQGILLENE